MLEKVGEPVFGTSANISGEAPPTELSDTKALWEGVAVAVDGGSVRGVASEVVDLTGSEPRTIRKAE
jgi:tRNA A37 threonylcarbamoyladenosine synthetase subunit TsaC/SUA5/YrdC